ncbi:MAG: GH39 family glycosyl hydrolase, partial [Xenococcaceae cyanobacterium]
SSATTSNLVTLKVDWLKSIAQTTPLLFGSNDYEITDLNKASDRVFQKQLSELNIGLIRIHHKELSDRWTNATKKTWDENKIKAVFDVSYPHKPTIVQNIPSWPKWMTQDKNGLLAPSEFDRYADFCADLVTILNQRQHRNILYWEPFNEQEKAYQQAGKLDQLWQIYNKAAVAMKNRDSRLKIGGPVLTWDNDSVLDGFLDRCGANIDFISWHRYASGDAKESTEKILAYPREFSDQVGRFRNLAAKHVRSRQVPLFLSEYNINFTWNSGETRQNTHIGAVWFASAFKHLAESGIDMAASWHLKDGIYGIIDPENKLRPAAHVFAWGNQYLIGKVVTTQSDRSSLEALAVSQQNGGRSLLLINKSASSTNVKLQNEELSAKKVFSYDLDESGVNNKVLSKLDEPLIMKPHSLKLLRF